MSIFIDFKQNIQYLATYTPISTLYLLSSEFDLVFDFILFLQLTITKYANNQWEAE